jgi:hypothetical protein
LIHFYMSLCRYLNWDAAIQLVLHPRYLGSFARRNFCGWVPAFTKAGDPIQALCAEKIPEYATKKKAAARE